MSIAACGGARVATAVVKGCPVLSRRVPARSTLGIIWRHAPIQSGVRITSLLPK